MRLIGPYEIVDADAENCGCGGDYCNMLEYGDRITFQIPADALCEEALAGCDIMSAACIDEQDITSPFDYEQNSSSVCFNLLVGAGVGQIEVGDTLLSAVYEFTPSATYRICIAISNNTVPADEFILRITISGIDYDAAFTAQGNGSFCGYITIPGFGPPVSGTWGIIFNGGDDTVRLCFESMFLCRSQIIEAYLINDSGFRTGFPLTYAPNGNLIADFGISPEIPEGCYKIEIADNEADVFFTNCVTIKENYSCTLLLKWRNNSNAFGYDYSNENYFNYARIQARLKNPSWPTELGQYLQSNNQNKLTNAQQSEIIHFVTGASNNIFSKGEPEYMLRTIASAVIHDNFSIEGSQYRLNGTGSIEPMWRNSSNLAHVEIELINQNYDGINRYCG